MVIHNNVFSAIIACMGDIHYINKGKQVGTGYNSYKAVTDEQVRQACRTAMQKNGLCIITKNLDVNTTVERWEQEGKQKQQVMVEVKATYMLIHAESNTSVEIQGIGIGLDPQDKSPGKATTYALKNALLNTFLIPTGDDPDQWHSDELETPQKKVKEPKEAVVPFKATGIEAPKPESKKKVLDADFGKLITYVNENIEVNLPKCLKAYELTDSQIKTLKSLKKP